MLRPPIGLPGPQLKLPPPPVFVPGKGLKPIEHVVETAFPALELSDEIYAQGLLELILNFLNLDESILDNPIQPQEYAKTLGKFVNNQVDAESREIVDLLASLVQNRPQNGATYTQ